MTDVWAAQTQETRDEIDRALVELSTIRGLVRIRELTGCDLGEAKGIHALRWRIARGQEPT